MVENEYDEALRPARSNGGGSIWRLRKAKWLFLTLPVALVALVLSLGSLVMFCEFLGINPTDSVIVILVPITSLCILNAAILPFFRFAIGRYWFSATHFLVTALVLLITVHSQDPPRFYPGGGIQGEIHHATRLGKFEKMLAAGDIMGITLVFAAIMLFIIGYSIVRSKVKRTHSTPSGD